MNFEKLMQKKKKAISPVLATVILIAITLIAAIAVAGFVFGLFGSFTSSAQVSATLVTCSVATKTCTVTLQNTGTANTIPTSCTLSVAGVTTAGTGAWSTVIAGTPNKTETCVTLATPTLGATAGGSFTMGNGATVSFIGTWAA